MVKPSRGSRGFQSAVKLTSSRPARPERVAKQLREELSQLMVREMKDPRVRMASVSEVRLSPDLRTARVMVSAVGEERERHAVISALRHAQGYLRAQLGGRLENLKRAPQLIFELDESIAYSVHISSMLRDLGEDPETAAAMDEAGPDTPGAVAETAADDSTAAPDEAEQ